MFSIRIYTNVTKANFSCSDLYLNFSHFYVLLKIFCFFDTFIYFTKQRLRQQMEEIYSDNPVRNTNGPEISWSSKSGKFLSQGSQHQRSLLPLWNNPAHNMPHSHSRYCKEFMDEKFVEVIALTLLVAGK